MMALTIVHVQSWPRRDAACWTAHSCKGHEGQEMRWNSIFLVSDRVQIYC